MFKHSFTCELKKDINNLVEEWKEDTEAYHKGWFVLIIEISYKCLEIGLIKVIIIYDLEQTRLTT